jgi:hypothetical protein
MKKLFTNKYFFFITVSFISAYILYAFVKSPGMNWYERAMVHDMIYGTAWKPFVYRTLLPTTTRITTSLLPEKTQSGISSFVTNTDWLSIGFSKFGWEEDHATEYFFASFFMLASLIGFAYSFRQLMRSIYTTPDWFGNLFTYATLLGLPPTFQYYSYLYDFPTLFLFTLALLLMFKQKWNLFLIIYFISCINKETTILLTFIFLIYFIDQKKMQRKFFITFTIYQILIFTIVKTGLFFIFINNPGSFVEFHLIDYNFRIMSSYSLSIFAVIAGLLLLLFHKWKEKPVFLRMSMWIAVPLIVLALFFGVIDELRAHYEVYPVFVLLLAYSISQILDIEISVKENSIIRQ